MIAGVCVNGTDVDELTAANAWGIGDGSFFGGGREQKGLTPWQPRDGFQRLNAMVRGPPTATGAEGRVS